MKKVFFTIKIVFLLFVIPSVSSAQVEIDTITPGNNLYLIWEADTYTPPFLPNLKPLISSGSRVKIIAYPSLFDQNSQSIPANSLNYTWQYNGRNLPEYSGLGQNLFILDSVSRRDRIVVTVEHNESGVRLTESLTLPISNVRLNTYLVEPLSGPQTDSLLSNTTIVTRPDIELLTTPLYTPLVTLNENSTLRWSVNGVVSNGQRVRFAPSTDSGDVRAEVVYSPPLERAIEQRYQIQFR